MGTSHLRCVARVSRHGCARGRCIWKLEAGVERYKKEKAARTRPIYQMPDLSIKNLGSRDSRELKRKAAESGTLLFFAMDMVEKPKARMSNPTPLLEAGEATSLEGSVGDNTARNIVVFA